MINFRLKQQKKCKIYTITNSLILKLFSKNQLLEQILILYNIREKIFDNKNKIIKIM